MPINARTNNSGAVDFLSSWAQSGVLVAGEFLAPGQVGPGAGPGGGWVMQPPKHIVSMQFNPSDASARVRTIQFAIAPSVSQIQPATANQPSGTPPNPPVVDQNGLISPAAVTNLSTVVLFPPVSPNPVIAGAPAVLPVAGDILQFAGDPTRTYVVASSVAPSTVNLVLPYKGTSTLRTSVSRLAQVAITPPPPPAAVTPIAVDCVALISWIVQGVRCNRIVSVGNGVSISAPSESVNIVILDNTYSLFAATGIIGGPTGAGMGYQYEVTVTITTGVRAAILPPTLTWNYPPGALTSPVVDFQPFQQLAVIGGSELNVPIPVNAGIIGYYLSAYNDTHPATPPVLLVRQYNSDIAILSASYAGPPDATELYLLRPDAAFVNLSNPGVDTVGFDLLWAIDG